MAAPRGARFAIEHDRMRSAIRMREPKTTASAKPGGAKASVHGRGAAEQKTAA